MMNKLTKENQLESNLELQWVFALADKCPVDCNSIASYLRYSELTLPKTFLVLNDFVKDFFKYINKKNKDISMQEIEIYFAWKIWKEKRINPKELILNSLCRNKAYLLGSKSMEELYRSGSRLLKVKKQLTDTIDNCKDEKLTDTLKEIKASVHIHTEIAIQFYNKVLENYKESLKEIDIYILQQKDLGGSDNA